MSDFITPNRLKKERGWNDACIKALLGEPDKTAPNPHYKKAPPMRLYALERVLQKEKSKKFKEMRAAQSARKAAAKAAVKTKQEKIIAWARTVPIRTKFPKSLSKARELGFRHWYNRELAYDRFPSPNMNDYSDEDLNRWANNYLRHVCTEYDDSLAETFGQTGKDLAYSTIRERVDAMIQEKFDI